MSEGERTLTAPRRGAAFPAAARAALPLLEHLQVGGLELQLPDGQRLRFGRAAAGEPRASLQLANWSVFGAALRSGDIGFAESYMRGDWSSPDLVSLLKLFVANRDALQTAIYGRWWGSLLHRLRHWLHRNSRAGSKRNIHAHYDLGNAFYALWLDETMSYSSAWFDGDTQQSMAAAQQAKMQRALRQTGVRPGDRMLEIGCGWGAMAECAATEFGARVTGITLSAEQLDHGRTRIADARLDDRVELRLQDYRDLSGPTYDAIVSIEMFEAVGHAYWADFFRVLREQLKAGGRACIQSITIRDDLFERYLRGTDFIQQYIFPGGLLPSRSAFRAEAARAGLRVIDEFAFGSDYAHTLARWRTQFLRREREIRPLGFDTRFIRLWEFYLAYCEAAFAGGNTDVVQFTLIHAG